MSTWTNKLSNLIPFGYFNSSPQEKYDLVHFKNDEKISKDAIEYSKIANKNDTTTYRTDKDSYIESTIDFNKLPVTHINKSIDNMTIDFKSSKVNKSETTRD
jgi:hypothetical protein